MVPLLTIVQELCFDVDIILVPSYILLRSSLEKCNSSCACALAEGPTVLAIPGFSCLHKSNKQ